MDDGSSASVVHPLERDIDAGRTRIGPGGEPYSVTSWATVDLEVVKAGESRPGTQYLQRTDGRCLIYAGLPHTFFGESESLKSWAALLACRSFIEAGFTVLYVDFEGDEWTIVERSRVVGIAEGAIGRALKYIRPTEPLKGRPNALSDLLFEETELKPSLVVLDGVSEAYALHNWDINKATDAAEFQKLFGTFAPGTAIIAIDHAGKDASRGVVGSQHKRAGLNGAEYLFQPVHREGRGGHSTATIKVTKDRFGYVREFAPKGTVGVLHVESAVDGDSVRIEAPSYYESLGISEALGRELLEVIAAKPAQSTNALSKIVHGGNDAIRHELVTLEADGKVRCEPGPHNAKLWFPGVLSSSPDLS